MALDIKTAAEVIALDLEGRGAARRAARETELLRRVLRSFAEAAGPVRVDAIVSAFPAQSPERVLRDLARLDEENLVRIVGGRVDVAYPFSAPPTPFVADLGTGSGDRYICCAIDALGVARCSGGPYESARGATTARYPSTCRLVRWVPIPVRRASWSGSGSERRRSGGSAIRSEPP